MYKMHYLSTSSTIALILVTIITMNYNTITMAFSSKLSPRLSHLGPHYHTRKSFVNGMTKTSILSHRCLNTSNSYSFSSPTSSSFQRISPSCFQKTRFQTRLNMNSSTTKGMTTMAYTEQEMKVVQDMLYRVRECNNVPPEDLKRKSKKKFNPGFKA